MERLDNALVTSLAGHSADRGLAISCYLDLDPAEVPTPHELSSHTTSLLTRARHTLDELSETIDHDVAQQARKDVERIGTFLETEFERPDAAGLALFVSGGDDIWHEVELARAPEDAVHLGRRFVLAPLLASLERERELVLAAVGRDRGTLWRSRGGRTATIDDLSRDGQGQHDQGGWSQARYARARDHEALDHLSGVAAKIGELIPPGSDTLLVVASTEEQRSTFEELLDPHVRDALLGWASVEAHADEDALQPEAEQLLEQRLKAEREEILELWRQERGRSGRAAASWDDAVAAAWEGRVESVVVDGRTRDGWECPRCGRGSMAPGSCAIDGTELEQAAGGALELVVRGTLMNGGTVRLLEDGEGDQELDATNGVAAVLRYSNEPSS